MELIIILLIVVLLFGGKKIPEIAKGLGKGIRDFKDAHSGKNDEIGKPIEKAIDKGAVAPRADESTPPSQQG